MASNLYVHFPFCRARCSYCTLYARANVPACERADYVRRLADEIRALPSEEVSFETIYFGGGSPALCGLGPVFDALAPRVAPRCEWTVELHPHDVTPTTLQTLKAGGVNRISMGVQSLDDAILAHMGRGYTADEAERAFAAIKDVFDNAGIDLIVGYPGEKAALTPRHAHLPKWGLRHCSVYSLQNERNLPNVPDDETVLDRLDEVARFLAGFGLERYEISNYAIRGFECRHNLAVWRGEDYLGLGQGAYGRVGLTRTSHGRVETVDAETDFKERRLFRLRTREGLETAGRPDWAEILSRHVDEGLLTREGTVFRLTPRGTEVCDAILADLI